MMIAAASIVVSLGVLIGSRHAPVLSWSVQPSAYLAICTAVANQAMRYAAFQGVMIVWWTKAIHGTTIERLHADWRAGMTFLGAVMAGRHMGLVGLACVFSIFVAIDGPLLQRASTVVSVPYENVSVPLNVPLAAEVPHSFTGYWINTPGSCWDIPFNRTIPTVNGTASNSVSSALNPDIILKVAPAYYAQAPMTGFVRGCDGTCKAQLRAPAFAMTECRVQHIHVDYTRRIPWLDGFSSAAYPMDTHTFLVGIDLVLGKRETIDFITGFAQVDDQCTGTFKLSICTLDSAVGLYDVTVTDDVVTLDALGIPRILSLANNTLVDYNRINGTAANGWYWSTLGGIVDTAYHYWASEAVQLITADGDPLSVSGGTQIIGQYVLPDSNTECYSYADPQMDILRGLNKLMFYTGIEAAAKWNSGFHNISQQMDPGLPINTTVIGQRHGSHNVYHTDLFWFLAAAIVEGVCIALILPTYSGWWKLGRSVSFSPVEIAKTGFV